MIADMLNIFLVNVTMAPLGALGKTQSDPKLLPRTIDCSKFGSEGAQTREKLRRTCQQFQTLAWRTAPDAWNDRSFGFDSRWGLRWAE